MDPISKALIVLPDIARELHAFGNILRVMLSGEDTGGLVAVMTEWTPPGGGPPLHSHANESEIFLVIEGKISYFVGGKWMEVGAGGVVYLPRGVPHCFRNVGEVPSRHWILTFPAGFEDFYARCADEFARSNRPDQERIVDIHHQYGIELLE